MLVLTLIRMSYEQKNKDKKFLINFILEKRTQIQDAGIKITNPSFGDLHQKYVAIQDQIDGLPKEQ